MEHAIRVVVADDYAVVRAGVRELLADEADITVSIYGKLGVASRTQAVTAALQRGLITLDQAA